MRSFDGITIRAHFYPASNRAADERVPTVLIGPGYPTNGDTNPDGDTSDQIGQRALRAEGYNTLTWDPRGIGGSGGIVNFDSPDFEARDVQALIDFVGDDARGAARRRPTTRASACPARATAARSSSPPPRSTAGSTRSCPT